MPFRPGNTFPQLFFVHLRPRLLCLALAPFALWLGISVRAEARGSLTLAEAEDLALAHEPGQAALLARADALEQRAIAAGALPTPQFRVGLANYPIESGGFTTEGMTQAQLGFRQMFPPGRSRAVASRRFRSLASEQDRNAEARGRDVMTATRQSWLEAYYWQHAALIVRASRPLFSDLVKVTESLYSVGTADQQDVLRAQLELGRLDDRLLAISEQNERARHELAQWIGSDAASRPMAEKLPGWDSAPDLAQLHSALAAHPALTAADAHIEAQAAGVELAEEQKKSGWVLDLGYGYRNGVLPNGDPRSDFVTVAVTVDLPFFQENRQDRLLAAASRERSAAMDSREALRRQLASTLEVEYARWRELGQRIALYEERILPQTAQQAEAAQVAYRSDAGDFAEVMRASIDELNTRIELVRLRTQQAQSFAVLANLAGLLP